MAYWLFNEETLLYGSREVRLSKAEGGYRVRGTALVFGVRPAAAVDREPLSQGHNNLVLPSVPAAPVISKPDLKVYDDDEEEGLLAEPLIKTITAGSGCESIAAVQSGRRSAVLRLRPGFWVRLKGCGDLYAGFPLAPAPQQGCVQLRGCMFAATAAREAAMTTEIAKVLEHARLATANTPLGWWVYPVVAALYPDVPRCCGLHITRGDRRLLTHVVAGLDQLLALLPPASFSSLRTGGDDCTSTAMTCLLADPPLTDAIFKDYVALEIADVHALPIVPPLTIDQRWAPLWSRLIAEIVSTQQLLLPLGFVYARLGWETGRVLRLLHDARISWGTYRDALATHCNAHPNNLVLILDDMQWLAPLDFDMAFCERHYLTSAGSDFNTMLAIERGAMALSLAGDEQANSGASSAPVALPESHVQLQWALRDTMVHWFLATYDNAAADIKLPSTSPTVSKASKALLKLALVLSSDYVA